MKMTFKTLICALLFVTGGTCFAYNEAVSYPNNSFVGVEYPTCHQGGYIKGFGGLNLARRPKWKHAQYKTCYGYVVGAALGYQFDIVSLEGEFSYRRNNVDQLKIDALSIDASGHIEQFCGMGNVLVNFPVTYCFVPYVGVGAGYRHFKPGVNFDERSDPTLRDFINSADEWGVFQLIGGFNFGVCQLVNLHLEYRYVDGWANAKCANHTVDVAAVLHF